ncbi:MAG TPA: L,D-transpeptidase [Solirubrobacteraceae bacterium]|jgi:lipoprotein-anchoring transpeptidase ErfK/SrfK|nr:L,D-transpeptidase [Solirubrobacteraceae bacterium]
MSEPEPTPATRSLRPLFTAIAVLVPLVPVLVALLMGGSGGSAAVLTNAVTVPAPKFAPAPATGATAATPSSSSSAAPKATGLRLPSGHGALVALLRHPTALHAKPGGRVVAKLALKTEFGSPQAMWVVRHSGRWLGVVSPKAGNNQVGWIPASVASLSRVNWALHVSLSARTLTVMDNGQVKQRYTVAIGAPDAPTPTGRFAVTDRLLTGDPAGPYGCCILALSAKAPHAIQDWSGGNRIAIHSTPETETIGEAVSHGCVRLTLAEGQWLINHIPLGTPAVISS